MGVYYLALPTLLGMSWWESNPCLLPLDPSGVSDKLVFLITGLKQHCVGLSGHTMSLFPVHVNSNARQMKALKADS